MLLKHTLLLTTLLTTLLLSPVFGQADQPTAAQFERLQEKVADLNEKLAAANKNLSQQSAQIPPLKDKLDKTAQATTTINQDLQTTKAAADQKISEVKGKTETQASSLEKLQATANDLQAKLDAANAANAALSKQLAPLVERLDKNEQATAALGKSLEVSTADATTKYTAVKTATELSINISWTLITGFLVMFMQAGFAMVETGFTRAKNVAHTMMMNFMVYSVAMLGFWICGFAIQFGGTGSPNSVSTVGTLGPTVGSFLSTEIGFHVGDKYFGLLGGSGFCLFGGAFDPGIFTLFLFQMVFMDTAATVPTGSMAERWRFLPFVIFSFCVGAFIYPIYGNWVWGGGWLAALGKNFGLGHGHVDFAGSSVVHMVGGMMALVGAWWLGPRIGKFSADGTPNPIPGHNIPMAIVGTFILAFGWFGFNPGSTLASTDTQIGIIATNTMLATASGACAAMVISWLRIGTPDPSLCCNGLLAGAVAITAPCAFVDAWAAVLLGAIGAGLMYVSVFFLEEKLKIDDPVGAISVHLVNGAWGVLCVGIFANGKYGDGWNGVAGPVKGLISGDFTQIFAELVGILVNIVYVGGIALLVLWLIEKAVGSNRVPADQEIEGLDGPEMGALGYTHAP